MICRIMGLKVSTCCQMFASTAGGHGNTTVNIGVHMLSTSVFNSAEHMLSHACQHCCWTLQHHYRHRDSTAVYWHVHQHSTAQHSTAFVATGYSSFQLGKLYLLVVCIHSRGLQKHKVSCM